MNRQVLIVTDNRLTHELCANLNEDLQIACAATGEDGLVALNMPSAPALVMACYNLPDMAGVTFLLRAMEQCNAVALLLAEPEEYGEALEVANRNNFFRVLPADSSREMLETGIFDGIRLHRLIHQEKQLRERIRELTVTDALTGCLTRPRLLERLSGELHRARRYSHFLSIIICDIDNLHDINDRHGYRTGDRILTGFAQNASLMMRQDLDSISRWGGDEFLIFLPETPVRGAGSLAERMRQQFAVVEFPTEPGVIRTSASFGITGYDPSDPRHNHTVEDLLTIADRCLTQAKAAGGNTVLCCP